MSDDFQFGSEQIASKYFNGKQFILPYDYLMAVSAGDIPGHSSVVIRGHNEDLDIAAGFADISESGNLTYLTSAETMNIVSTSTDDKGTPTAGIGLRSVLIIGIDDDGNSIQETVILNGTTDVETSASFLRVNNIVGLTAGSTGWNVGNISATASSAATNQCQANATQSISHNGFYTVPLNNSLYVYRVEFNTTKTSGGSPVVEIKGYARAGGDGNAFIQLFDKRLDTGITNGIDVDVAILSKAIARTDITFKANTDKDNTDVRVRLYGILVQG